MAAAFAWNAENPGETGILDHITPASPGNCMGTVNRRKLVVGNRCISASCISFHSALYGFFSRWVMFPGLLETYTSPSAPSPNLTPVRSVARAIEGLHVLQRANDYDRFYWGGHYPQLDIHGLSREDHSACKTFIVSAELVALAVEASYTLRSPTADSELRFARSSHPLSRRLFCGLGADNRRNEASRDHCYYK